MRGPPEQVKIEPKKHHSFLDIKVMEVKGKKLNILKTATQKPPSDTAQFCDLLKRPNTNKQYEVKI